MRVSLLLASATSLLLPCVNAYINYTTVTGYFLQDDPSTNSSTFNFTASNFGLINRTYPADATCNNSTYKTQWQRFADQVASLNAASASNVVYKVLYMGRHGQGYHNAAETYYGTPAWNCYWSEKDGNDTVIWADAHLTPTGVQQALAVNAFWNSSITIQKIPTPERYYTSPLTRCLATANLTFAGLDLPSFHPFVPEVKELFREGISGHTCDRRSNKTYIHQSFPWYTFEDGFSEEDLLWEALHGETNNDEDIRSKTVLDQVFLSDSSTYISITSHSGEISSLLRGRSLSPLCSAEADDLVVLGHRTFSLSTGGAVPVLVKAESIAVSPNATASMPYTMLATCASPNIPTATSCNDCSCCTAAAR